MFIRTTKNQRGHSYYHLVEAYRLDGKVKQRTLMSLGRVEDNRIEELATGIKTALQNVLSKHTRLRFDFEKVVFTQPLRKSYEPLDKKTIKNKIIKSGALTVAQAMDELNRVMAIPVKLRKQTIWVRTDIPPNAQNLMKAIGMRITPKILQKTEM